ncbi:MAG TPA: chemotaxis protein CheW [Polyangia bacterium]|jgi:purine-binding chemotaxis protein CheW
MTAPRQLCTFTLDGLYLGIDVREVQEVMTFHEMTRVPRAAAVIRGLINLRGQIVPALDLRRRLKLGEADGGRPPMNVVVRSTDGPVSLLVDEIGDVVQVAEEDFERRPETLTGVARELIQGAYKLEDRLLLVLDTARVLQLDRESAARPRPGKGEPE